MKTKKRHNRIANLLFILPILIIVGFVVYGFLQVTKPGTVTVEALAQNKYLSTGQSTPIDVLAKVGSVSGTTPLSVSLAAGQYEVSYATIPWYQTPASKEVAVGNGQTAYSTGVYSVIVKVVTLSSAGFNATKVLAEHGVTPVVWINTSTSNLIMGVSGIGTFPLSPGQNYTNIFQSVGTYLFTSTTGSPTSSSGSVEVQ